MKFSFIKSIRIVSTFGIIWLCISIQLSFAQTATLTGTITDSQTGEPLWKADIEIRPSNSGDEKRGGASNRNGVYEIRNLSSGVYSISVSYLGYQTKKVEEVRLADSPVTILDVQLIATAINLDPVVVTASREQEKALNAPASISVVEAPEIRDRPALTAKDYIQNLPAVDIASTGIAQSSVTVRGFNDVLTGSMLLIADNRYAHVPGLRVNLLNFLPLTNEDIDRIEILSGPASALYGPNSANGVMHLISNSPFDTVGTTISVGGGGRDFFNVSQRDPLGGRNIYLTTLWHANRLSQKFAYKISAQYYQGIDWQYHDPEEPAKIILGHQTPQGKETFGDSLINNRDFQVEKLATEVVMDYRPTRNLNLILNSGFNRANQVELTDFGAAQARDWIYGYVQGRLIYKNLFLQGFTNFSDAGDTYLLRTGDLIEDNSKLYAGQIQHRLAFGDRQQFTYGVDALLTRPNSKGSIYGRNENDDDINEYGAYFQSETEIFSKLDLVAAARVDDHNHLDARVLSPRLGIVFKPAIGHNFRFTYNRAFGTPSATNLFLDFIYGNFLNPFDSTKTLISVRAMGVPQHGFTYMRDHTNRPMMMSPWLPAGTGYVSSDLNSVWPRAREILIKEADPTVQDILNNFLPAQLDSVSGDFRKLNLETREPGELVKDVKDIKPLKPVINNTFEVGYKGVIGEKLFLSIDVYHTHYKNFIGPFNLETPNVFANTTELSAALEPTRVDIMNYLISQGTPRDTANSLANGIISGVVDSVGKIPLGVVTPQQVANDTDAILTVRNFGDISLNGLDLSFAYYLNRNWSFSGNFSLVAKNGLNPFSKDDQVVFQNVDGVADVHLNAPGRKGGVSIQYQSRHRDFSARVAARYVEGFQMASAVWAGNVPAYTLFDVSLAKDLPFSPNTRFTLSAENVLDRKHREFVGAPEMGRMILVRLIHSF
jgi:outer membrane receptor for ferrienterochelin and colicins